MPQVRSMMAGTVSLQPFSFGSDLPIQTEEDAIAALVLITNQDSNFDPSVVAPVLASLKEYVEARIYHLG